MQKEIFRTIFKIVRGLILAVFCAILLSSIIYFSITPLLKNNTKKAVTQLATTSTLETAIEIETEKVLETTSTQTESTQKVYPTIKDDDDIQIITPEYEEGERNEEEPSFPITIYDEYHDDNAIVILN